MWCSGKDSTGNRSGARDVSSISGLGRSPGVGNGNSPVFLPGKSHGQRSLTGYSPWGCKELDTTVQLRILIYHAVYCIFSTC